MTDMGQIGEFDAIWCCHALEHLSPRDVGVALAEFRRVLRPGGAALILVPDLEDVKPTMEVVYDSPAGPITGHDMYYGHARMVEDNHWMAHKCGFIQHTLRDAMTTAGFLPVQVNRVAHFNLFAIAIK